MGKNDLKLYVRGFFGSKSLSTEALVQNRYTPVRSVFDLSPETLQHVVSNESIIELYTQVVGRQVNHAMFDFREHAIKLALRSFGLTNFLVWAELNKESPTFTQLHADFITDTMRFISTGKRDIPIDSWERMIVPGSNDPVGKVDFDRDVVANFPRGYSTRLSGEHQLQTYELPKIIARWLSQPSGFSDMVVTLYILFGDRSTSR